MKEKYQKKLFHYLNKKTQFRRKDDENNQKKIIKLFMYGGNGV